MFHGCSQIVFRWEAVDKPMGLRGIDWMVVKPGTIRIEKFFTEFNVGALLVDEGLYPCKQGG